MHDSDVSGQSGHSARTARSTGYEPNLIQNESGTTFVSIADGDDEYLIGIGNLPFGQAPPPKSLEDHACSSKKHGGDGCS